MPIYDIFEKETAEQAFHFDEGFLRTYEKQSEAPSKKKDKLFSSIAARLFFLMLFGLDLLWCVFSTLRLVAISALSLITWNKFKKLFKYNARCYLNFKRSLVCALALFVALFSPALGIMFSCSYFLMYDKAGIDEVVPSVLRAQFKEFME